MRNVLCLLLALAPLAYAETPKVPLGLPQLFDVSQNPYYGALTLGFAACDFDRSAESLEELDNRDAVVPLKQALEPSGLCRLEKYRMIESKPGDLALFEVLTLAALNADSEESFLRYTEGKLTGSERTSVKLALPILMARYTSLDEKHLGAKATQSTQRLHHYLNNLSRTNSVGAMEVLYGVQWPYGYPVKVGISPTPGNGGFTAGVKDGHIISYMPLEFNDYRSYASVALHEMGHVFFAHRNNAAWNGIFADDPSPSRLLARAWLDEALTTAITNGWWYAKVTGKLDDGLWYDDPAIDRYAKAIYPIIAGILESHTELRDADIAKFPAAFAKAIPNALYEADTLFQHVLLLVDRQVKDDDLQQLMGAWGRHFQIRNFESMHEGDQVDAWSGSIPVVIRVRTAANQKEQYIWSRRTLHDGRIEFTVTMNDIRQFPAAVEAISKAVPR